MAADRTEFSQEVEDLSFAVTDLVAQLDPRELEMLAILSIKEHRKRLQAAQDAYDEWRAADPAHNQNAGELKSVYMKAMLDNRVQMTIVAVVVKKLGRIPDTPDEAMPVLRSDGASLQS
jgi:hypothetical protein